MSWEREAAFDRLRAENPATDTGAVASAAGGSTAGGSGIGEAATRHTEAPPAPEPVPEPVIRVPGPAYAGDPGDTEDSGGGSPSRSSRRTERSARHPVGAVLAAGLALGLGVGGYALGSHTPSPPASQSPITLYGPQGQWAGYGAMGSDGAGESWQFNPFAFTRTVFTATGMSAERGTARAWSVDSTGMDPEQTLSRMGRALGIEGAPELEAGAWRMGNPSSGGPVLEMHLGGVGYITYLDPGLRGSQEGQDTQTSAVVALATAQDTLSRMGVPTEDHEWAVQDQGESAVHVRGARVVAGHQTGLGWQVRVRGGTVVELWGSVGTLSSLGDYRIVSEAEAVDRLMDPRFSAPGGQGPFPDDPAGYGLLYDDPFEPTTAQRMESGDDLSWPVRQVTLTDARLALGLFHLGGAQAVLLPSYEFTDAEGRTWSMVALADEELDFSHGR